MARYIFDKGREKFLNGEIHWLTDDIQVCLVDTTQWTPDQAVSEFLSEIAAGARSAAVSLTGKSSTGGIAGAATPVTFANVAALAGNGDYDGVVFFKNTGVAGTSPLLVFVGDGTNLPIIPNGGDIDLQLQTTGNKIFKL